MQYRLSRWSRAHPPQPGSHVHKECKPTPRDPPTECGSPDMRPSSSLDWFSLWLCRIHLRHHLEDVFRRKLVDQSSCRTITHDDHKLLRLGIPGYSELPVRIADAV